VVTKKYIKCNTIKVNGVKILSVKEPITERKPASEILSEGLGSARKSKMNTVFEELRTVVSNTVSEYLEGWFGELLDNENVVLASSLIQQIEQILDKHFS